MRKIFKYYCYKEYIREEQFSLISLANPLQEHLYFLTVVIFKLIIQIEIIDAKRKTKGRKPQIPRNSKEILFLKPELMQEESTKQTPPHVFA